MGHHPPLRRQEISVITNRKAFLHIVRDHQAGGAGGVVEGADQVGGHAHGDGVKPRKGLVVHQAFGVECDGPRQGHAASHAT